MRTTLQPRRVQSWLLVGLNSWHRVTLRQEVERHASDWMKFHAQDDVTHTWRSIPPNNSAAFEKDFEELSLDFACVVIDKSLFAGSAFVRDWSEQFMSSRVKEWNFSCNRIGIGPSTTGPCDKLLPLLWDWSIVGNADLVWATQLGFVGVIHNFVSLRSWARVAVERGSYLLQETHPLLNRIKLPSLFQDRS